MGAALRHQFDDCCIGLRSEIFTASSVLSH